MVRVVKFAALGGPEVLRIEDGEVRLPDPDEVRIRVKAIGLNRAEAMFRSGIYIEQPDLPSGLGFEAAGIIESVGAGVEGLAPGDAVSVIPAPSILRWQSYGELAVFPARYVVKHPASLSMVEAAAVWMAYVTAYGALVDIAGLQRGEPVVISAASSSVGIAAIQTANLLGAVPIALTRGHAKRQALLEAGAAHVVVMADADWEAQLSGLVGEGGVRAVFDPVAGPIIAAFTNVMARGGILIEYGILSPDPAHLPLGDLLGKSLTVRGYVIHELTIEPARLDAARTFVLNGLQSGALRPVIARTFAFDDIVAAHAYLEAGEQFGKIVVTI